MLRRVIPKVRTSHPSPHPRPRSRRVAAVRRAGGGGGGDHHQVSAPRPLHGGGGQAENAAPAVPETEEGSAMIGGGEVAGGARDQHRGIEEELPCLVRRQGGGKIRAGGPIGPDRGVGDFPCLLPFPWASYLAAASGTGTKFIRRQE